MRVMIVGGYGIFGGRLVELLQDDARLTLLVAGRSLERARSFCADLPKGAAQLVPVRFDRAQSDVQQLKSLRADLVVDASGPFQAYGDQAYALIERCIECGCHYLDLADGSDFVAGVARFDARARAAGVYVLAGASSFPVLSAAVVRRLSQGMHAVHSIRGGIAPSPYAVVGLNVIRAIASYAGQSTRLRRDGVAACGYPFAESMGFVIAVPGRLPLERRRFSLVDVPDLLALPELWPQAQEVWMGAAPVPAPLHRLLSLLAWLVRLRWLPTLSWLARPIHAVANHVRWGEHRGGMFVQVQGHGADGQSIKRAWHLAAEGDDGPYIPCMAVLALIRRALEATAPQPGARAALRDVELSDYEALFAKRTIYTGVREVRDLHEGGTGKDAMQPLYQRVLGTAWDVLALQIRQLHDVRSVHGVNAFRGLCNVQRGRNPLARLMAHLMGFPGAGDGQPLDVTLRAEGAGERWTRSTSGRSFSSVQQAGRGAAQWLVRERFGAAFVDMALLAQGDNLRYIVRRWGLFGIALPLWMGPRSNALETVQDGKFNFDVEIRHPLAGLIVRYAGWLEPANA